MREISYGSNELIFTQVLDYFSCNRKETGDIVVKRWHIKKDTDI